MWRPFLPSLNRKRLAWMGSNIQWLGIQSRYRQNFVKCHYIKDIQIGVPVRDWVQVRLFKTCSQALNESHYQLLLRAVPSLLVSNTEEPAMALRTRLVLKFRSRTYSYSIFEIQKSYCMSRIQSRSCSTNMTGFDIQKSNSYSISY